MNRRRIGYVVVAVVLVAGLVISYFATQDPAPVEAEPPKPSRFTWADGSEMQPVNASVQLLIDQAGRELDAMGIGGDDQARNGYTVELTIDRATHELGDRILAGARQDQPGNLRMALVAVDPRSGRIVTANGYQPERPEFDYTRAWQNPGTAFTPFSVVALLQKGKGLGEVYDGRSPRKFGSSTISNTGDAAPCGESCSVAKAMELSVNTVFADIAHNEVGTKAVARAAIGAGIPHNVGNKMIPLEGADGAPPNINIALGGDVYQARPVDMAGAYATFAANGTKRVPHLVARVVNPATTGVLLDLNERHAGGEPAFAPDDPATNAKIARNVTEALGSATSGPYACDEARPCPGKPGLMGCTEVQGKTKKSDDCVAWMVGYTPQVSAAVWLGTDANTALVDKAGAGLGTALPGKAWQRFMNEYLKGTPVEPFPAYEPIGTPR